MSAAQADQEARRAAEMVLVILGEHVDHVEGTREGSLMRSLHSPSAARSQSRD